MLRNSSVIAASNPVPTMNRNAPAKKWFAKSPFPQFARLGPANPANTPPASTREMALGRNASEAASATANRYSWEKLENNPYRKPPSKSSQKFW